MSFTDWSFLYSVIQTKQNKQKTKQQQQQRKKIKICKKQVSRLVFYAQSTIMGENKNKQKTTIDEHH